MNESLRGVVCLNVESAAETRKGNLIFQNKTGIDGLCTFDEHSASRLEAVVVLCRRSHAGNVVRSCAGEQMGTKKRP